MLLEFLKLCLLSKSSTRLNSINHSIVLQKNEIAKTNAWGEARRANNEPINKSREVAAFGGQI